MPKPVEIEEFGRKLDLLAKRLNWSRSRLAQAVGVDKSLVARWANGSSRPTGNSLMQLTAAVAAQVEGFTAADWEPDVPAFARRLGLDLEAIEPPGRMGLLEQAMPRALADHAANAVRTAEVYEGFYRRWMRSPQNDGAILRRALRIWRAGPTLHFTMRGSDVTSRGICLTYADVLYLIGENGRTGQPIFGLFNGAVTGTPRLLTGMNCSRSPTRDRFVGATSIVLEFLGRPSGDPEADERRWQALIGEDQRFAPGDETSVGVPAEIARLLTMRVEAPWPDGTIDQILLIRTPDL